MKILILFCIIVIVALVILRFFSNNDLANNDSRPPTDHLPKEPKDNDKLILVTNATEQNITKALTKFCNIYNKEDYAALPRLWKISSDSFVITFPYDIDFVTYCFAVNFLKYPIDVKWNADVRAWLTTKKGEEWIKEISMNKKAMLFLAQDDKEYDNVYLTTIDNIGYKLGFAAGQEKQLLPLPKELYVEPKISKSTLNNVEYIDFK